MKLCFLGDASSQHLVRWVNYFSNKDHDVSLITFRSQNNIDTHLVNMIKIFSIKPFSYKKRDLSRLTAIVKTSKIRNIISQINPDLVHAHNFSAYGSLTSFVNFHPVIVSAWGSDILLPDSKSKIQEYFIKKAVKNADLLHCDGNKTESVLNKFDAGKNKKTVQISFGIDVEFFSQNKKDKNYFIKYGFANNDPVILNLRGLRYELYGAKSLLHAIPEIVREIPNARFLFVGEGLLKDKFIKYAEEKNLSRNIIFTGFLKSDELAVCMASSDIYVSTSISDSGIASSTAEAMASNIPVIVTDDLDNRMWVKDEFNGYLIPPKNSKILAEKIVNLCLDKSLREEFGKRNRQIICEKNNVNIEMAKMEKIYEELVTKRNNGAL